MNVNTTDRLADRIDVTLVIKRGRTMSVQIQEHSRNVISDGKPTRFGHCLKKRAKRHRFGKESVELRLRLATAVLTRRFGLKTVLRVSKPRGKTAPWLKESVYSSTSPRLELVAAGRNMALLNIDSVFNNAALLIHRQSGVLGTVRWPADDGIIGMDKGDRIYAAGRRGRPGLYRADVVQPGTLSFKRLSLPDARWWYAANDVLVGTDLNDTIIGASFDGGNTKVALKPPGVISDLAVRGDGVVVVRTQDGTGHVTRDRGVTWRRLPSALPSGYPRHDWDSGWIILARGGCDLDAIVLGADPSRAARVPPLRWGSQWLSLVNTASSLTEQRTRAPTLRHQRWGPNTETPSITKLERCATRGGFHGSLGGGGKIWRQRRQCGPGSNGIVCLAGSTAQSPPKLGSRYLGGAVSFVLLDNLDLRAAPRLLAAETMALSPVPATCTAGQVYSHGGLSLLFCEGTAGSGLEVFAPTRRGWTLEYKVPTARLPELAYSALWPRLGRFGQSSVQVRLSIERWATLIFASIFRVAILLRMILKAASGKTV
ncbi:MAG: hypothetical protein GY946_24880 [bacterium]|nr:hypothetical protein [bacterium]